MQEKQIEKMLNKLRILMGDLTKVERDVILKRFALLDGKKYSLEEIGKTHGVTKERIRQIFVAAMKKMNDLYDDLTSS